MPGPIEDRVVSRLARETGRSEDDARRVYRDQVEEIDRHARVKKYVPVIAARHAREILARH